MLSDLFFFKEEILNIYVSYVRVIWVGVTEKGDTVGGKRKIQNFILQVFAKLKYSHMSLCPARCEF